MTPTITGRAARSGGMRFAGMVAALLCGTALLAGCDVAGEPTREGVYSSPLPNICPSVTDATLQRFVPNAEREYRGHPTIGERSCVWYSADDGTSGLIEREHQAAFKLFLDVFHAEWSERSPTEQARYALRQREFYCNPNYDEHWQVKWLSGFGDEACMVSKTKRDEFNEEISVYVRVIVRESNLIFMVYYDVICQDSEPLEVPVRKHVRKISGKLIKNL